MSAADKEANWPNFLIVGTAKGGTTSIYKYLENHPDIYMSKFKEPCFFSFSEEQIEFISGKPEIITKLDDYIKLFNDSGKCKFRGEASTPYLYFYDKTIHNIKKYIEDYENLKIIIILRNPVDRAYSQYMMRVRDLKEDLTFAEAIEAEKMRMEKNYHFDYFYSDRGFYYKQVKAYLDNFEHVKIYLYEDLKSDTDKLIKDLLNFLNLDETYEYDSDKKHNISGAPKIRSIASLLVNDNIIKKVVKKTMPKKFRKGLYNRLLNLNYKFNLERIKIPLEMKNKLRDLYKEDILQLSKLIDRDLSMWTG